jgi:hypothetical protein
MSTQKLSPGRLRLESQTEPGSAMLKVIQLALAQLLAVRLWRQRILGMAMLLKLLSPVFGSAVVLLAGYQLVQIFTQRAQPVFPDWRKVSTQVSNS